MPPQSMRRNMASMFIRTEMDTDHETTSIADWTHGRVRDSLQSQCQSGETRIQNQLDTPLRKRRMRAFAMLTTITTTLWCCQTIVLLHFLPTSMVEASNARIPPPPPPRPKIEETSSEPTILGVSKVAANAKSLEPKPPKIPPPPPPKVAPTTSTDEESKGNESKMEVEATDKGHTPPPPPPRIIAKTKETATTDVKGSSSSDMSSEESPTTPSVETEQTPLHREEEVRGLYHYVQQQQQQQQQQQMEQHKHSYYPQQYHNQQYYQYNQPRTVRHQTLQRHAQPRQAVQSSFTPPTTSALTSTLKGLWGKVERGLDDLAGLENSVAGQAQKLVNSAISTASTASRLSPSALRSLAQSGAATVDSRTTKQSQRRTPAISNAPLKPYGQKYQVAREAKEKEDQKKNSSFQPFTAASRKKRVHDIFHSGDKGKSIATKGGATSSPYGYPQNAPEPPSPPSYGSGAGNESGSTEASGQLTDSNRQSESNGNTEQKLSYTSNWNSPKHQEERESETIGETSPSNDSFRGMRPPESQTSSRVPPMNQNRHYGPSRENVSINHSGPGPSRPQPRQEPLQNPRDPHSRGNRIPWDTNQSPSKRQAPDFSDGQSSVQKNRPDFRFEGSDKPSWKRALEGFSLPPLPRLGKLKFPRFRKRNNSAYYGNLDAWESTDSEEGRKKSKFFGFFKKSSSPTFSQSSNPSRNQKHEGSDGQPALVASMLSRCNDGKSVSLLRSEDTKASKSIGRYKAILDVLFIVSVLLGFKLLSGLDDLIPLPSTWQGILQTVIPKAGSVINELLEGSWALFAFLYAALFKYYRDNVLGYKMNSLSSSVSSSVKEESEYSQLYLRLLAATPMDRNLPDRLASVAKTQVTSVVAKARLNSFVGIVLASLTIMTVSAVGPFVMSMCSAATRIILLKEWRQWPIPWEDLFGAASSVMQSLFRALESQGANALQSFLDNPIQFSFHLTMFFSLLVSTLIPGFEERRALSAKSEDAEDDDDVVANFDSAEEWSRLGTSSASRLSMLSENGSVENALARWRASRILPLGESIPGISFSNVLRLIGYGLIAAVLAGSPIVVSYLVGGETPSLSNAISVFQWDSLFDLSFLQIFLFGVVWQTLKKVIDSGHDVSIVQEFQSTLASTQEEVEEANKSNGAFQVMGSVSPSAGITVRDLWAAHATKRAWAIRGANMQCKNGEILVVLGEDGNGKTRLLTTIAESLAFPPKRSITTNKVRGLITIGGLDVAKWDHKMLKRRIGIFLSDVRMIADSASLFSGWTMEEILEPVDGLRSSSSDPLQRTYTKAEKSAMILALKITGLYKTLLARLPSKTSTIFTANEEDLRPTSLKPRSTVLSPGEWSKLILARVLAQTIYDNDNALASDEKIENSLMGSILLLDEPTTMHSEVDEGQLYRDLRLTGAATIISTNKWATGRFADQICVVKNGSIVEMGSHNELLARGPQQSLYAAQWHAMTIQ